MLLVVIGIVFCVFNLFFFLPALGFAYTARCEEHKAAGIEADLK